MGIKRLTGLVFDVILTAAFIFVFAAIVIGIGSAVGAEDEPVAAVSADGYTATAEKVSAPVEQNTEPEVTVVEIEVTYVEPVDCEGAPPVADLVSTRRLYDVPLDEELQRFMIAKAEEIGIDPAVIFGMARKESTYDPGAIGDNGESLGLLHVQPKWNMERMERLGCPDLLDPYQNVTVAIDLMGSLMTRYDDVAVALTVYNNGHYPGYVTDYAKTVMQYAEELNHAE